MNSQKSLSIVINEEEIVEQKLLQIVEVSKSFSFPYEILVINDGSTDTTPSILNKLTLGILKDKIRLFHSEKNSGIGASYTQGIKNARMEYVMFLAIDLIFSNEYFSPFINNMGKADVLVGIREYRSGYNVLMRFNSWLYIKMVQIIFKLGLKDVNWICIYPKKILEQVEIQFKGIVMMVEILVKCRDLNATFMEIPTEQHKRTTERKSSSARLDVMIRTLFDLIKFSCSYHFHLRNK